MSISVCNTMGGWTNLKSLGKQFISQYHDDGDG